MKRYTVFVDRDDGGYSRNYSTRPAATRRFQLESAILASIRDQPEKWQRDGIDLPTRFIPRRVSVRQYDRDGNGVELIAS